MMYVFRYPEQATRIREVMPDPIPQTTFDNPWVEPIAIAKCRFNRVTIYDGRRLHNQYVLHVNEWMDAPTGGGATSSMYRLS